MKNLHLFSFLIGVLASVFLFLLYSFNYPRITLSDRDDGVIQIHQSDANSFRENFTSAYPGRLSGFDISIGQWRAINQVVQDLGGKTDHLSGFRIYHGLKSSRRSSDRVSMAYALDSEMQEPSQGSARLGPMVTTADNVDDSFTTPCPPFCD